MKKILTALFILFSMNTIVQTTIEGHYCEDYVDTKPEYIDGKKAMYKMIVKHFRYPSEAKERGETGRVIISFVVLTDGSTTAYKIERSVSKTLDAEAMRVIKLLDKWKPATKGGKAVNAQYTLPVSFALANSENPYKKKRRRKNKG